MIAAGDELVPVLGRQPFHAGFVTAEFEAGMRAMSTMFGCDWALSANAPQPARLVGTTPPLPSPLRIAHSVQGPVRFELIGAVPDTLFATSELLALHHFAYWSRRVEDEVRLLVDHGWTREFAAHGADGRIRAAHLVNEYGVRIELVDFEWRYESYCAQVGATVDPGW